ncbi:MAG: hypothetical protein ACRD50_07140 [Candidatus Acidiferrales bacterium]
MKDGTNPNRDDQVQNPDEASSVAARHPDLKDPRVVLSLLEADQVVAAKRQTYFGRRTISLRARLLLWGLRVYVVIMMLLVLISVIRALQAAR